MSNYHCKKFCGNDAEMICSPCLLKETTDEQFVREIRRRFNEQKIVFWNSQTKERISTLSIGRAVAKIDLKDDERQSALKEANLEQFLNELGGRIKDQKIKIRPLFNELESVEKPGYLQIWSNETNLAIVLNLNTGELKKIISDDVK